METIQFWSNMPLFLDLQEPLWLLSGLTTIIMIFVYRRWRRQRPQLTINHQLVAERILPHRSDRTLGHHLGFVILIVLILGLIFPASRPVIATESVTDKSLVTWVVDSSASMETIDITNYSGEPISRFDGANNAIRQTVNQIPDGTLMQIVTFADADKVTVGEMTRDSTKLRAQINQLTDPDPQAATATLFGLQAAIDACVGAFNLFAEFAQDGPLASQAADPNQELPCTIILLSDGECTPQPWCVGDVNHLTETARSRGLTIHTVSWGDPDGDRRTVHLANPEAMAEIARLGGGSHLATADIDQLVGLYQEIVSQIQTQTQHQTLWSPAVWAARILIGACFCLFGLLCRRNRDLLIRLPATK